MFHEMPHVCQCGATQRGAPYLENGHLVSQLTLLFGGKSHLVDDFDGHVSARLPVFTCQRSRTDEILKTVQSLFHADEMNKQTNKHVCLTAVDDSKLPRAEDVVRKDLIHRADVLKQDRGASSVRCLLNECNIQSGCVRTREEV